jgi:hypothetical protein
MRLWSLHPQYLDRQGLVALWRESLLAQQVLSVSRGGYQNHPQLVRFRETPDPMAAIAAYLWEVAQEGRRRGYRLDEAKIRRPGGAGYLEVTTGQMGFEWQHLLTKLRDRSPEVAVECSNVREPLPHPLFRVVPGPVAPWERAGHPSQLRAADRGNRRG